MVTVATNLPSEALIPAAPQPPVLFPGGSLSGLGGGWTWVALLSTDGAVVDSCDPAKDRVRP